MSGMRMLATCLLLWGLVSTVCRAKAVQDGPVSINLGTRVNTLPDAWLGVGEEMWHFIEAAAADDLQNPRLVGAIAALARHRPFFLRVGGITADWVTYDVSDACEQQQHHGLSLASMGRLRDFSLDPASLSGSWPDAPENLTQCMYRQLLNFSVAANVELMFDLNELTGRDCHVDNTTHCEGDWNTTNLETFLRYLKDEDLILPNFHGFELGNELTRSDHINMTVNIADNRRLRQLIETVWTDNATRPKTFGPSTDICDDTSAQFMDALTGTVSGFTFHSYPNLDDSTAPATLLNPAWLRTGIMLNDSHANSGECIVQWNAGPRQEGLQVYLTETNSAYTNSEVLTTFVNGHWGHTAFFALVTIDGGGRTDYFIALLFQELVGHGVLNTTTSSDGVLAYAYCARGSADVVLSLLNPGNYSANFTLEGYAGDFDLYLFESSTSDVLSNQTKINGQLMSMDEMGNPTMPQPVSTHSLVLPPSTYAFAVTRQWQSSECQASG
ncbi:uncharacterized protein MONBRDRAFT_24839 [Monosiga brevicollis MX1]|uniref:Beta-glucuronidase C-terminal domain-containing protein n=1 Tax=Monosiga brevicollis TaxID=81824 RepID=A9UXW6_MONBE|nr:uncharacterized protein MONBRDRAFT_24839 [Monosiga brevicollis MX1]EDQ89757.1 predicted protein [Monosiga brevicollis MX1]|eukprot:XP_001745179.1 hypothetical protein [Monosiga brevicollis MX1]